MGIIGAGDHTPRLVEHHVNTRLGTWHWRPVDGDALCIGIGLVPQLSDLTINLHATRLDERLTTAARSVSRHSKNLLQSFCIHIEALYLD